MSEHHPAARTLTLLLIAVIIAACAVIDQHTSTPAAQASPNVSGGAPASAISSAWYCPLVPATTATPSAGAIVIFNPSASALPGKATIVPQTGNSIDVDVNVPPRSRISINPGSA